jgi:hypothetical protein
MNFATDRPLALPPGRRTTLRLGEIRVDPEWAVQARNSYSRDAYAKLVEIARWAARQPGQPWPYADPLIVTDDPACPHLLIDGYTRHRALAEAGWRPTDIVEVEIASVPANQAGYLAGTANIQHGESIATEDFLRRAASLPPAVLASPDGRHIQRILRSAARLQQAWSAQATTIRRSSPRSGSAMPPPDPYGEVRALLTDLRISLARRFPAQILRHPDGRALLTDLCAEFDRVLRSPRAEALPAPQRRKVLTPGKSAGAPTRKRPPGKTRRGRRQTRQ